MQPTVSESQPSFFSQNLFRLYCVSVFSLLLNSSVCSLVYLKHSNVRMSLLRLYQCDCSGRGQYQILKGIRIGQAHRRNFCVHKAKVVLVFFTTLNGLLLPN